MRKEPVWSEVRSEFINEEGFLCIDAWKTANDEEEGKVIAYVDTLGGRVIYVDPMARIDENAQEIILAKSREYQKEHPFNVDELEVLAKGVVNFESEGSPIDGSGRVLRGQQANLPTYSLCRFQNGKVYNCDLSASYNIGSRYFIRDIRIWKRWDFPRLR